MIIPQVPVLLVMAFRRLPVVVADGPVGTAGDQQRDEAGSAGRDDIGPDVCH